jgi:hypothetical protein
MKQFSKKRLTSLILAVVMTVSAFALSAYANGGLSADAPEVGWAPGENAQFWYTNTALDVEFMQELTISGTLEMLPSGRNTIQEYVHINNASGNFYAITTHPQYYGTTQDYDDQVDAQYVMQITGLYVWDKVANGYVDCFATDFGIIPAKYAVAEPTEEDPGYFQCAVFAKIMNLETGAVFDADWNDSKIYLEIPAGL